MFATTRSPVPAPDLIDRIANALPEELRGDYYREMAHCRALPESDEMLRILRAMQFLTVLIEQTPARLAAEREQMAAALSGSIVSLEAAHHSGLAYQKQLEARLASLPDEVASGISAEAIAAKVSERLRQHLQESGLLGLAEAIGVQASGLRKAGRELSASLDEFAHPRHGAVSIVQSALISMKTNTDNAADHIRAQMKSLREELRGLLAVVAAGTLVLGFASGILYHRWITSPVVSQPAAAPQAESTPVLPQPKSRQQSPTRPHVRWSLSSLGFPHATAFEQGRRDAVRSRAQPGAASYAAMAASPMVASHRRS